MTQVTQFDRNPDFQIPKYTVVQFVLQGETIDGQVIKAHPSEGVYEIHDHYGGVYFVDPAQHTITVIWEGN